MIEALLHLLDGLMKVFEIGDGESKKRNSWWRLGWVISLAAFVVLVIVTLIRIVVSLL